VRRFVEKPMTGTLEEALEVERIVKGSWIVFQVGFMRRFYFAYREAKRMIEGRRSEKSKRWAATFRAAGWTTSSTTASTYSTWFSSSGGGRQPGRRGTGQILGAASGGACDHKEGVESSLETGKVVRLLT